MKQRNIESFEDKVYRIWKDMLETANADTDEFEELCERMDREFQDEDYNVYVRIVWDCDEPEEIYNELLDLGQQFDITDYIAFRDDTVEGTVIVARHRNYLKQSRN